MIPKCECGNDCCEAGPSEWIFAVPLTKIEIRVLFWSKPRFYKMCSDCLIYDNQEEQRKIFNAGMQCAYEKMMEQLPMTDHPIERKMTKWQELQRRFVGTNSDETYIHVYENHSSGERDVCLIHDGGTYKLNRQTVIALEKRGLLKQVAHVSTVQPDTDSYHYIALTNQRKEG